MWLHEIIYLINVPLSKLKINGIITGMYVGLCSNGYIFITVTIIILGKGKGKK